MIDYDLEDDFKNDIFFNKKYKIIDTIKKNKFKLIYKIKDNNNVKYICKVRIKNDNIKYEIQIFNKLKNIQSEYISNYIDYIDGDKYIYFITEYIDGLELNHYLRKGINIHIYLKLFRCIEFIHNLNIIHCDIKSNNIIVDQYSNPKLIDFDLAKLTEDGNYLSDKIFGTLNYLSPESYDLGIYTKASDIWSLGMMIYINITKKYPFDERFSVVNSYSNFYRRNEFKYPNLKALESTLTNNKVIYILVSQMLEFKDYNRLTISEAINTIENYINNKIENIIY